MPEPERPTKSRAKRINLQYFKNPHWLRSWRLYLSIGVPVVALVWFLSLRANGQKVYSAGPLSASHAAFGKQCGVCHEGGGYRKPVSNDACQRCHDAPAHHPHQVKANSTPTCGSCHIEHKGSLRLAHTKDLSCAQCHSNLKAYTKEVTEDTKDKYIGTIEGFDRGRHPEFRFKRKGIPDPGTVKLNHLKHLQPGLTSPDGKVQLTCQDCHRPQGAQGRWTYAKDKVIAVSGVMVAPDAASMASDDPLVDNRRMPDPRAYMAPIRHDVQCAGCHTGELEFDPNNRFPHVLAPHGVQPKEVQKFLIEKYTNYFDTHPGALSEPLPKSCTVVPVVPPVTCMIASMMRPLPPPPHTREEWIRWQVAYADILLFDKGCKFCHTMIQGEGPIPTVAKPAIKARWLDHAAFDHDAHRMMTCTACHGAASHSEKTSDILLPLIDTCRRCHRDGGAEHDAADARCSECHAYHDWRKEQFPQDRFNIQQLRGALGGM